MKKKFFRAICIAIALVMLAAALSGCGGNQSSAPPPAGGNVPPPDSPPADNRTWDYTVSFSHAEVVSEYWARVFGPDIEAKTNGRIKTTIHWAGSLLAVPEVPRGLQSNVAHIANMPTPNYIDVLPLNCRILQLPFIGLQDPIVTANIYMQLLDEFPEMQQELADMGIKVLGATPLGRYDLKLSDKSRSVRLPEDLQGRQIVPYKLEFIPMLDKYNASASYVPPAQVYETLERGVIEGYIATWAYAGFFGLTELVNQHVDFGDYGAFQELNLMAMSISAWNDLPADMQQALLDVCWYDGGYEEIWYGDTDKLANAQRDLAAAKGDLVNVLTPEEMDVWKAYVVPLYQETIDDINSIRGDDAAQRIYDRLLELLAAVS